MNIASEVQDYLKSLTVLYVEDEADVREQFRQFLSRLVGVLITAENGSQGLAAYREHNPDIIITDIQMPVMDGLAMLEEIRSVDTWVPVIMLTAFEKTDCLKRSINLGVSGYVIKPIEVGKFIESLLKCARSLLLEKKVTQQNEELRDLLIRMTEQNKELELLASTDALTGLTNRRRFLDSLEKERSRTKRYGGFLSLIMFDVDHFKHINDTWGHSAGDAVLCEIGRETRQLLRITDVAARYGGEEFVVLLPETELTGAHLIAERLRQLVSDTAVAQDQGTPISVTVSIGVAMIGPDETSDAFLNRVDQAMYLAKDNGRNRVEIAKTEL